MSNEVYQIHLVEVAEQSKTGKTFEIHLKRVASTPLESSAEGQPPPAKSEGVKESDQRELWKFEYQRAQEMLQHYDNLTWHIGSIFIAGILVLTGLGLSKDGVETLMRGWKSLVIVYGLPGISFLVLLLWALWFRRMRSHYRFRDEVLHRLESNLKLYHFLRIVEANKNKDFELEDSGEKVRLLGEYQITFEVSELENDEYQKSDPVYVDLCDIQKSAIAEKLNKEKEMIKRLSNAKRVVWGAVDFKPMVDVSHSGPTSYMLVWGLAFFIPLVQLWALFILWVSNMYERIQNPERLNLRAWDKMYCVPPYSLLFHAAIPLGLLTIFIWLIWRNWKDMH